MDKTYDHLYKELYRHLYNYCITGDENSKNKIQEMKDYIDQTTDNDLKSLYQIISCIDPYDNNKFLQKSSERMKIVQEDDYENIIFLYSILSLVFRYIYPEPEKVDECNEKISNARDRFEKIGGATWKLEFEEADYAIQIHINKDNVVNDAYGHYLSKRDFRIQNRSFMAILKGFSSSTPFFYPALRERFHNVPIKGGGFFVKWKKYGIVIDPGINFMENMHMAGLGIKDIDVIFITHNHVDHNGDLITIDDLAYQGGKKDIVLYSDRLTGQDYAGRLNSFKRKNWHVIDFDIIGESGLIIGEGKNIKVEFMPTQHMHQREEDGEVSYAMKLSLSDNGMIRMILGFTSDTAYLDGFPEFFKNCNYIVANISETNQKDYKLTELKDNHLGFMGCAKLIEGCKLNQSPNPKFIISEFWAGKGDVRKELVRELRRQTECNQVYPGDIGMFVFLDQPTFLCSFCGKEEKIEKMSIIRSAREYSKFDYICERCILLSHI